MEFNEEYNNGDVITFNPNGFTDSFPVADENSVLKRVFKWMALGLGISGVSAFAGLYGIIYMVYAGMESAANILMWVLLIGELILVWQFTKRLPTMSAKSAKICFIAYSIIDGLTMSVFLLAYTTSSVFITFLVTASMFGIAALYGKLTKNNLNSWGTYLIMGLWGIIIAGIVNIFILNSVIDFVVTVLGIVIFIGLTAYDTNKIKQYSEEVGLTSNEEVDKVVIYGALQLYLDFINLFIKLLRLLGKRRD
ncbi:MAG: Bax inhibitor-1/YccA family protein [Clostridia bacterium]|nr:Bax inhibitor-1/YccA family protein [Clostridia bacterium]